MKLLILDRDGVINYDSDEYIKSPEEWIPLPGSIEAIAKACQAGFNIAVATNQSGIARGYFNLATLEAMHDKMRKLVEDAGGKIDYIAYCPHGPEDSCECRKPKPGLFNQIKAHFGLKDFSNCLSIGDSLRDLEAAAAVSCPYALVLTGKGVNTVGKMNGDIIKPEAIFADLCEALTIFCAIKN